MAWRLRSRRADARPEKSDEPDDPEAPETAEEREAAGRPVAQDPEPAPEGTAAESERERVEPEAAAPLERASVVSDEERERAATPAETDAEAGEERERAATTAETDAEADEERERAATTAETDVVSDEERDRAATAAEADARVDVDDEERAPDTPAEVPRRGMLRTLGRTVAETKRDNVTDLAAGLTYYAILSIFPMLLAVLAILGLIGDSATDPLIENLRDLTPGPARDTVITAVENLQRDQGSAGVLFVVSLAGAVWSASRYVDAFMRASNVVYDVEEGRPIWKKLPVRLGITVIQVLALVVSTMAVVLTGDLARQAGDLIGLESSAVTAWNVAKWPVAVLVVLFMLALLYWAAPNVRHPGFRWVTPGSVLAVVVWVAGSVAFALYIEAFGSYNETYGTLGGVIAFLAWLWLINIGILLGAELNAELERTRQIEAGLPADEEPFLEPRDTRKMGSGP